MLSRGLSRMTENYKVKWPEVIPLGTVYSHFEQIGGTAADFFAMILRRTETQYIGQAPGSWSEQGELAGYLTAKPAAFAEALRQVEQKLRAGGIKLLEHHTVTGLPEIESILVAMLGKPFDKTDRENAISALARLEAGQLLALLERELPRADIDTRHALVQAAGRCRTPQVLNLLVERGKVEKAAKVKAAIEAVLEVDAVEELSATQSGEAGYAAIDGSFVALPPLHKFCQAETAAASDEECIEFMRIVEAITAHRGGKLDEESCDRTKFYHRLPQEAIEATFALMTEGKPLPEGITYSLISELRKRQDGREWYGKVLDRRPLPVALRCLLGSSFGDIGYLIGASTYYRDGAQFGMDRLTSWIENHSIGLRELIIAEHGAKATIPLFEAATDPYLEFGKRLREILGQNQFKYDRRDLFAALKELPGEAVWPWLVECFDVFDEGLGLRPASIPFELSRILNLLKFLPILPQRYFAKVLDIAVSEKRPLRRQAMALLRDAKDLSQRIEALLDDKRLQVRINAAVWLADIRSTASEGALRRRLKKEKSDPVRAALIESLQRMGFDLSDVIGPVSLIAEAEAVCAKQAPVLPDWLVRDGLPVLHWRSGATVPALVTTYWLGLAIRLKDPGASGQFGIYLDQLDPADARTFSNWILDSWIAYDTASATLEEAAAYAAANYSMSYRWIGSSRTPADQASAIAQMTREKHNELINSGADTKGMLALACRSDPVFAANRVRWFLKKHGRRSNQAMSLLEALAGTGQPAALQVVIAASARLKQKSTQARAAEIAERYAEDRGWSFEELADRTVPSAGFDDDGVLDLPCGEEGKLYTARLDAMLAIHLFNPDGKEVKTIPAGDDENTRDAKKAFSAAKKELAQVIDLQGTRLFEAMCVERAWPVADWRLAFHEHPVMRRLIERLVWQGLSEDGTPLGLFRPTQEGDFTDADDTSVEIDCFAKVRLAHGALVDEATCAAWVRHLKDYEIKPFIAQFDALRAPLSAEQGEAEVIDDRLGWKADSLTFRGASEKRGYERVMRDGGGCNEYVKSFASHGITATIFHTGSYAVDENNPVALKELRFARQGHRGAYRLKDVPPAMLAECWADYHAIAAKGAFDPDWEKVAPW